jgi:hypothetical protein
MMPPLWVSTEYVVGGQYTGKVPLHKIQSPPDRDTVPGYKSPQDTSVYYNIPNGINVTVKSNVAGGVMVDIPMELYVPTKYVTVRF